MTLNTEDQVKEAKDDKGEDVLEARFTGVWFTPGIKCDETCHSTNTKDNFWAAGSAQP